MNTDPQTPAQSGPQGEVEDDRPDDQSDEAEETNIDETVVTEGEVDTSKTVYVVDESTSYSLFSNPPNLGDMRQRLFDVQKDVVLSEAEFDLYFPFVDNVWRKDRAAPGARMTEGTTETYWCRLKSNAAVKNPTPRPIVDGRQQRRKRKREEKTCGMALKITHSEGPVRTVTIARAPNAGDHTHDLEYMDANKRNSGVMDIARREGVRGFLPGSVYWRMCEEPEKMEAAGGKFMKVSDVRNVQYAWRQAHQDVTLKAHAGYNQQRSGPRSRPSAQTNGRNDSGTPAPRAKMHPLQQAPSRTPNSAPIQSSVRLPADTLSFPEHARGFLYNYLPDHNRVVRDRKPHVTLTYAMSLDGRIALAADRQTAISGPETKAMTHFLRSRHDAILVGVNTAITDNPGLNCRLEGAGGYGGVAGHMQPRPVIIDPRGRLVIHSDMRMLKTVHEGKGRGPWIVVGPGVKLAQSAVQILKGYGGEFLQINEIHPETGFDWTALFEILYREGIRSVMIEGGGKVLSQLLQPRFSSTIDSVIITIAPTFFGKQGVEVSPGQAEHQDLVENRLCCVSWQPMGSADVVLCGQTSKRTSITSQQATMLPGIQEFSRMHPPPQMNGSEVHTPHRAVQTSAVSSSLSSQPLRAPPQPVNSTPLSTPTQAQGQSKFSIRR